MLVPAPRLLFWFALIALPFSLAAVAGPWEAAIAACAIGGLIVIAAWDGMRGYRSARVFKLEMEPLARLTRLRAAKLVVKISHPTGRRDPVRVALAWPESFESDLTEAKVTLPGESEWARIEWPCRARQRGRFRFSQARLGLPSPWRLWEARRTFPLSSEVRVYSNLQTERRSLAGFFLNRGQPGTHAQRQVGQGREFEQLRDYAPGDSFEDVHWRATARRGHPVTKMYQVERTQELYVVVDTSRLSGRVVAGEAAGSEAEPILERYLSAALVLGLAAQKQGDLFGVLTFSDRVESFVRAGSGTAHYHACRDALHGAVLKPVSADFEELAGFLRLRLRRRTLLMVLTSLDDPVQGESFLKAMQLLCRQHLVLVNSLESPGTGPLFRAPDAANSADVYARLAGHIRWQRVRELEKVLRRQGVQLALLGHEPLAPQLLEQYVNVRQRQML